MERISRVGWDFYHILEYSYQILLQNFLPSLFDFLFMCLKSADRIANSVDNDQTAPSLIR